MAEISKITFKTSSGELKEFKRLNGVDVNADSQVNIKVKDSDGNESIYTKQLIKGKDGKEEYVYMHFDGGSKVEAKPQNDLPKDRNYFWTVGDCGWNRDVDKFFDGMLSIDNSKTTTDGKDDGHLTWTEIGKHTAKGALAPVKAIVKNPIKSAAVAGVLIAAGVAFPPLGVVLAAGGLLLGLGTAIFGGVKAAKAKTDAEAKAAWENVGTGTVTAILSAIGLKKANAALKARNEIYNSPPAPTSTSAPTSTAPTTPAEPPEYSGIARVLSSAGRKCQGAWETTKHAGKSTLSAGKTAYGKAKHPIDTINNTINKFNIPKGQKADGMGEWGEYAKTAMGFFDKRGTGMDTISNLQATVQNAVANGQHWQAKTALSQMSQIIKGGKISPDKLDAAKAILADCTKLTKVTKFINRPPSLKPARVLMGNIDNAFDNSAVATADAIRQMENEAYEFAC